jgi:type II secretory pathway pseudopilin PulG
MNTPGFSKALFRCRKRKRGFSLVEVVFSLGVVTFCSFTLIALIPGGLMANKSSREQITALNLCRNLESDLKATAPSSTKSPLYGITLPGAGATLSPAPLYDTYSSSTVSFGTYQSTSQYRFSITLTGSPTTSPNDPVMVKIQATWPAAVVPAAPLAGQSNPPNVAGTVNLEVAINRFGS